MKGVGMLLVSLRGVNFEFWSHLWGSEENTIICSPHVAVKVSLRVSCEEIFLKYGLFQGSKNPIDQ